MHTIFEVFIEFVTILLLFHILVFWPQGHEGPYPTQDGTRTPCSGRQNLNYWTARGVSNSKTFRWWWVWCRKSRVAEGEGWDGWWARSGWEHVHGEDPTEGNRSTESHKWIRDGVGRGLGCPASEVGGLQTPVSWAPQFRLLSPSFSSGQFCVRPQLPSNISSFLLTLWPEQVSMGTQRTTNATGYLT